jgi:hypothetical protein
MLFGVLCISCEVMEYIHFLNKILKWKLISRKTSFEIGCRCSWWLNKKSKNSKQIQKKSETLGQ